MHETLWASGGVLPPALGGRRAGQTVGQAAGNILTLLNQFGAAAMKSIGWVGALLVFSMVLFFAIRTVLRVWIAARRTMRQYRTVPAEELPAHLRRLLTRSSDGDFLVITDPDTDRFIQLRKYIHSPGQYGLSLDFPRAPWSERYYHELQARLESDQMEFVLQPTLDHPVTEFLQVDCKRDIEFAGKLIRMVLFEVLGLPGERQLRIDYQGT